MPQREHSYPLRAHFEELPLPESARQNCSAVIPTVMGTPFLKYGTHAYYFLNFHALTGLRVTISHKDIVLPGLARFFKANYRSYTFFPRLRALFQKYHYDFSFLEQVMLMTVPHSVTSVGNGRFLVNLWSYFGYIEIDCRNRTAKYNIIEEQADDMVLGSVQFYDKDTRERYYMSYSLRDSLRRAVSPQNEVLCRILKHEGSSGATAEVWSGEFVDYVHDIVISRARRYCVMCELGMFCDANGDIIPSKVLVLDLKTGRSWTISRFIVAAHAQFDPNETDVVYFSNHNFQFKHSSILQLLRRAIYGMEMKGPATVYKYRLTADGPREMGAFTRPDFFRLTNMHVFNHRGRKMLAAIGAPNFIYIVDADTMGCMKRIEILHPSHVSNKAPCVVGTFSPSIDGECVFVQTTRSLQMVDIASGRSEVILSHDRHHTCANHMITSADTAW